MNRLAAEFCAELRSWLSAEQMAEVVRRNAAEPDRGICHSHDFCDANQAILNAFERVMGREWRRDDPISDDDTPTSWSEDDALIDRAWDLAKAAGFDPQRVPPSVPSGESDEPGERAVRGR